VERKDAGSRVSSVRDRRRLVHSASLPLWSPRVKRNMAAVAFLTLIGIVAFAVTHETTKAARAPTSAVSPRAAVPARPAFTSAEETYIRALWPIHGEVERSTVRLSLGQIFYKINDLDRRALKARADEALATYRRSEARIRALEPPASVRHEHQEYLTAVDLFRQSVVEVLKMFEDGRDDHLNAAYPLSQQASDKIREVGLKFWRNEFPPN
jgi:hypothetical protein